MTPHDKLLIKLHSVGITAKLWLWFRAYLSSRFQCVAISGIHSELHPVTSGVPKGSIVGPLLFLVFINDTPSLIKAVNCKVLLYADETKCFYPLSNITDSYALQQDLDSLFRWSISNTSFNKAKSFLLHFTSIHLLFQLISSLMVSMLIRK